MTELSFSGRPVYLAYPIDGWAQGEECPSFARTRELCLESLKHGGAVVYEPGMAFQMPAHPIQPHSFISAINNYALDQVNAVVALLPERSIGVCMELQRADSRGVPTLVISERVDVSWALAGLIHSEILPWSTANPYRVQSAMLRLKRRIDANVRPTGGLDDTNLESPSEMRVLCDEDNGSHLPTQSHADDAGFDLFVAENIEIPPGRFVDVPAGVSIEFPPNVWGMITGRSSTLRKHQLLVNPAIIDTGYRGPLFAGVWNMGQETFHAHQGSRLAQLIPLPNLAPSLRATQVGALSSSARGTNGFGSTGV